MIVMNNLLLALIFCQWFFSFEHQSLRWNPEWDLSWLSFSQAVVATMQKEKFPCCYSQLIISLWQPDMHRSSTLPSEHSVAPERCTDILGAFHRGTQQQNHSDTMTTTWLFTWFCCFFPGLCDQKPWWCFFVGFFLTNGDVHFVGPRSLVAAADLAAVPASMVLCGAGDLKRDGTKNDANRKKIQLKLKLKNTTMT